MNSTPLLAFGLIGLLSSAQLGHPNPSDPTNADWIPCPSAIASFFSAEENRHDHAPFLRWRRSELRVSIAPEHVAALAAAMAEWNAPGIPHLVPAASGSPAEIQVSDVDRPEPEDEDTLGTAEPMASDPPPWGPALTEATVEVHMTRTLSPREYQVVLTHEIGHALGFWHHAADPKLVMATEIEDDQTTHVSDGERQVLRELYAAPWPRGWDHLSPTIWDYLKKGLDRILGG